MSQDKLILTLAKNSLMLSLYVYLPPLKAEDWLKSAIVELPKTTDFQIYNKENGNFIDITSGNLVVSKYKYDKAIDLRIIQLPAILIEIIKKHYQLSHDKYLFMTTTNKIVSASGFSHYWSSIKFENGQKINPDILRQLYIFKIQSEMTSIEDRKKIAYIMGHCLQTQQYISTHHMSKTNTN